MAIVLSMAGDHMNEAHAHKVGGQIELAVGQYPKCSFPKTQLMVFQR